MTPQTQRLLAITVIGATLFYASIEFLPQCLPNVRSDLQDTYQIHLGKMGKGLRLTWIIAPSIQQSLF